MKLKILVYSIIIAFFFTGFSFTPETAYAKTKSYKSSHSKSHKKSNKKGRRYGKKQSVEQSLINLATYFPEYKNWQNDDKLANSNNMQAQMFDDNSVFTNYKYRKSLIENINNWLGTPYRHGGHTIKRGVDCSNFTSCIVRETFGIKFPASPGAQAVLFKPIRDVDKMQFGDLIFFSGRNRTAKRIGHVGFYIGNGLFAHSSSGRGVIYTHISEGYYSQRFRFGGRFVVENWAHHI